MLLLMMAVSTACAVFGLSAWAIERAALRSRLMMMSPDRVARDQELNRYAVTAGRRAFAAHCASCHGLSLAGDRLRGVPNLADSDWLYGTGRVSEIERIILYGIRSGQPKAWNLASMPAFATADPYNAYKIAPLTPREVNDVSAYVFAFQHKPIDAAAVARGALVFRGRGQCFDCHGPDARGDPAIGAPDLTDDIWLYGDGSMQSIGLSIAQGRAGACPPWIGTISAATIRAIAVYVNWASTERAARKGS